MQEFNILRTARHPNVVRLYESFETQQHIVFVMEVCGGGDLLTYVKRRRKLKEDVARHIFM
jgi:serine/threonine protein kinase